MKSHLLFKFCHYPGAPTRPNRFRLVIPRDKNPQCDELERILPHRKTTVKTRWICGAGDEIRTRDFLLGKQTFYH